MGVIFLLPLWTPLPEEMGDGGRGVGLEQPVGCVSCPVRRGGRKED